MEKIRINSHFRGYWGKVTPKVGDVLDVVLRNRRGYLVKLDGSDEKYLVYFYEADLIIEP